jgi:D-beta-D-heptose 7-phosphate kinase / D-beta-D-heptose 1-phosphate adenosyltransferase
VGPDLISVLQAITGRRAMVVGDTILDVYLRGATRGLCREAPAPVVAVQSSQSVPGGAANCAVNVAALGARPVLVSVVGDDLAGYEVRSAMRARGVPTDAMVLAPGRETVVKRRVVVGSHILVRLDEGVTAPITGAVDLAVRRNVAMAAQGSDVLVVSDYGYGTLTDTVRAVLVDVRRSVPVTVVDAKNAATYACLRPTVVTPNYAEAVRLLGAPGLDEADDQVRQIADLGAGLLDATAAEIVAVTLRASGAMLFERGRPPFHSRVPERTGQEVVGAGDAFTAALALALSAGADAPMAVELATFAAGDAARRTTVTAVCSRDEISGRLRASGRILAPAEVAAWASDAHDRGQRIVFTNGCFDLFHEGHVAFLSDAKALGDLLIVGVNDDESVRSLKGPGRPVVDLSGRMRLLAALSCVDQVVPFSGPSPLRLIETVHPHVFAKGGDYQLATIPEAELLGRLGTEIHILGYLEDRSTSRIIERVRSS